MRHALVPPDIFRLRYRSALADTTKTLVVDFIIPSPEAVNNATPTQDIKKIIQLVLDEFTSLHEGNISRFKLKPSDFSKWQQACAGSALGTENK